MSAPLPDDDDIDADIDAALDGRTQIVICPSCACMRYVSGEVFDKRCAACFFVPFHRRF